MQASRHASLFACAHKVSVIEVGADVAELRIQSHKSIQQVPKGRQRQEDSVGNAGSHYLERVGSGLRFDEDAVRMMAPYMLPYNEQSIYDAFDTAEFLSKAEKVACVPGGRFNVRGTDNRHLSCTFKKTATHRLKPIKRQIMKRAMEMHKKAAEAEEKAAATRAKHKSVQDSLSESQTFVTSGKDLEDQSISGTRRNENQWDEYLVSILSKPTAQWVVSQKTNQHDPRFKALQDVMLSRHGAPTTTELVEDDSSDSEAGDFANTAVKDSQRNTRSARLLRSVMEVEEKSTVDTVPYGDKSKASFYRLPAGIKKEIKAQQRAKEGAQNSTAANIVVIRKEPSPPPKLKDFVNPAIRSTVFDTENMFERDWLTGNAVVHRRLSETSDIIQMENLNKYEKHRQQCYPRSPTEWHRPGGEEALQQGLPPKQAAGAQEADPATLVHKVSKGLRRWTDLPKPIEEAELTIAADVEDEQAHESGAADATKTRFTEALVKAADEWRHKWHMNARFSDATEDDLIRDMADIHPHVRMKAVATCAMAANYKPPPVVGVALSVSKKNARGIDQLSPRIFTALECLLQDVNDKVRLAAAVTLHTLNRPLAKAREILRASIKPDKNQADRWAAVQCLGFYGECDSEVIGEVIEEMMRTQDMMKYEKAASLLAHISQSTPLVHSMLGEQLNDCSWRRRVMASKCLPKLHGELNRDLQNKLVHLLWSDGQDEVRHAAGQALGKCGYAKLVHDRLRDVLNGVTAAGDAPIHQSDKVEAINKIGFLGLMTVQLLPSFTRSFRDEYVSIREAACRAAGRIRVKDPSIVTELVRLASQDPVWQIKARALQAIGLVGYVDDAVRRCLLWALRFEAEAGVRAEACRAIIQLRLCDKEVLETLQNHTLVEQDEMVRQELTRAVELNGVSATEDMAMVAQIKEEVRRLCNRNDVYRSILSLEHEEDKLYNAERMQFVEHPEPSAPSAVPSGAAGSSTVQQRQVYHGESTNRAKLLPLVAEEMDLSTQPVSAHLVPAEAADQASSEGHRSGHAAHRTQAVATVAAGARPTSGASSYYTEAVDTEIELVTSRMEAVSRLSSDHKSQKSALDTPRPPTTGLAKKRARTTTPGASSALDLKQSLLSMSLDHTLQFHEEAAAASARAGAAQAAALLGAADFDRNQMHPTESDSKQLLGKAKAIDSTAATNRKAVEAQYSDSDPVGACRNYTLQFLFKRYTQVDIATPSTLSPIDSRSMFKASAMEGDCSPSLTLSDQQLPDANSPAPLPLSSNGSAGSSLLSAAGTGSA